MMMMMMMMMMMTMTMMMMMSIVHDGVASWNCLCGHLRRHGNRCIVVSTRKRWPTPWAIYNCLGMSHLRLAAEPLDTLYNQKKNWGSYREWENRLQNKVLQDKTKSLLLTRNFSVLSAYNWQHWITLEIVAIFISNKEILHCASPVRVYLYHFYAFDIIMFAVSIFPVWMSVFWYFTPYVVFVFFINVLYTTLWAIKTCRSIFVHNFEKCWPIKKIISLLDSAVSLQQVSCHISHSDSTLFCEIQKINNSNTVDAFNTIIDLFLNISII